MNRFQHYRTCVFVVVGIVLLLFPSFLPAKITGLCANCHTMHNSQNGGQVARPDSDTTTVGWGADGKLGGGNLQEPMSQLLVTNCVGCHSSTTTSTIINMGGSNIPIVYNTSEPEHPLAGGNFFWVAADETKGHNVYGISGQDSRLSQAPGRPDFTCTDSCHITLAVKTATSLGAPSGCQGCHIKTSHHVTVPWYRFLKGRHGFCGSNADYVAGIGSSDWEQNPSTTNHNYYKGSAGPIDQYLCNNQSMSQFCDACHQKFHATPYITSENVWIRHPTDIVLPTDGEYSNYDPTNSYSVDTPVAWTNPSTPTRAGAVVMCLSCHRAHGSPYTSMLRWDYNGMVAGGGGSGGCFNCHTQKN